jgi:class 3 adenylate cyclase/ABC-type phosphate transport system substrate-binding protein
MLHRRLFRSAASICMVVFAVCAAAQSASLRATIAYDADALAVVLPSTKIQSHDVTLTPSAAPDALPKPLGPLALLTPLARPPALAARDVRSFPVAVVPICVAYHATSEVAVQYTVAQLLANLRDAANTSLATPVLVNATSSTSVGTLLALGGFSAEFATGAWPAAVRSNPRVRWAASEADARTILVELYQAGASVSTAAQIERATALPPRIASDVLDELTFNATTGRVTPVASSALAYPLLGPLLVHIDATAVCDDVAAVMRAVHFLWLSAQSQSAFTGWGLAPPPLSERTRVRTDVGTSTACLGDARAARGAGSSAASPIVNALLEKFQARVNPAALSTYVSQSSGIGKSLLLRSQIEYAAVESVFNASELTSSPTMMNLPFVAFPISMAYNLPTVSKSVSLVIPECTFAKMMSGNITYWNHPEIAAANPSIVLPALRIYVLAREDSTTSSQLIQATARAMEVKCTGASAIIPSQLYDQLPSQQKVRGATAMAKAAASKAGSLTYVSLPAAEEQGLPSLRFLDDESGGVVGPTELDVLSALEDASITPQLVMTLPDTSSAYPMIDVSYFALDGSAGGNCTTRRLAVDFMLWAVTSPIADGVVRSNFAFAIGSTRSEVVRRLRLVKCDGVFVYPVVVPPPDLTGAWIAIALVLVAAASFALYRVLRTAERDTSNAPTDNSKPFGIVFTDIQSSTALWSQLPASTAAGLDLHHAVIRAQLNRHRGYEVKTIGDSFMVAFENIEEATAFALDVQAALYEVDWGTEVFDEFYDQVVALQDAGGSIGQAEGFGCRRSEPPQQHDRSLWKGIRVRIGIDYGVGSVTFDEVSKGYDYYGTVVNTAARVESVGHGGQILLTEGALQALQATSRGTKIVAGASCHSLGLQPLRGLDALIVLHQVLPQSLARRCFPPLRLDRVEGNEEADVLSGTDSISVMSTPKQNPGGAPYAAPRRRSSVGSSSSAVASSVLLRPLEAHRYCGDQPACGHLVVLLAAFSGLRSAVSTMKPKDQLRVANQVASAWRVPVRKDDSADQVFSAVSRKALGSTIRSMLLLHSTAPGCAQAGAGAGQTDVMAWSHASLSDALAASNKTPMAISPGAFNTAPSSSAAAPPSPTQRRGFATT